MPLKRSTPLEQRFSLPKELEDSPSETPMTWACKQVNRGTDRAVAEMMLQFNWRSIDSTELLQAYYSYVDSTLQWENGDRIFDEKSQLTFESFANAWDSLPPEVAAWIMDKCVYVVNPQWRPSWLPTQVDEDDDEDLEKKDEDT